LADVYENDILQEQWRIYNVQKGGQGVSGDFCPSVGSRCKAMVGWSWSLFVIRVPKFWCSGRTKL